MALIESENIKKRKIEESNNEKSSPEERETKTKIVKTDAYLNLSNDENKTDSSNNCIKTTDEVERDNKIESQESSNFTKENVSTEKPEEVTEKRKTGFVFGSTTKFGNMDGFKMFKREQEDQSEKNLKKEEAQPKKEGSSSVSDEKDDVVTSKPVFGMGSTFGNAFQAAISKKSVFDDLKPKSAQSTKDDDITEETAARDVYKKVDLEKQEVKSGEENEENLFQVKAKVYQMDLVNSKMGWKERGFGIIKVNKFKEPVSELYTSRIIMRQNGNLKLILNVPIVKGFKVLRGIPSSLHADKFIRLQMIENDKPIQYAVKVGQSDNAQKLFETIEKQISH